MVHINAGTVVLCVLTFCNFASKVNTEYIVLVLKIVYSKAATPQILTLTQQAVKNNKQELIESEEWLCKKLLEWRGKESYAMPINGKKNLISINK